MISTGSCEVIWSEYSHFCGISVALLGLGWFVIVSVLLVLAWRDEQFMRAVRSFIVLLITLGTVFMAVPVHAVVNP